MILQKLVWKRNGTDVELIIDKIMACNNYRSAYEIWQKAINTWGKEFVTCYEDVDYERLNTKMFQLQQEVKDAAERWRLHKKEVATKKRNKKERKLASLSPEVRAKILKEDAEKIERGKARRQIIREAKLNYETSNTILQDTVDTSTPDNFIQEENETNKEGNRLVSEFFGKNKRAVIKALKF